MTVTSEPRDGRGHRERVAIVHPWVRHVRGGEKVFFELARAFPGADLHLLHCREELLPPDLRDRALTTTFLQRMPFRKLPYRSLAPLLTLAVESLDLSGYDLIVSSAFGWTHGVIPADDAYHVSYVHSPPRYLWTTQLPADTRAARLARPLAAPLLQYLRLWDTMAATRVDAFLANSETTAGRIRRRYGRPSTVVHPPVETSRLVDCERSPAGYALSVGELVAYKRVDLAVRASRLTGIPLIVVGDGPERGRLERLAAGAEVHFVGRVSDTRLTKLLAGASAFIHPGVEDFGIATVEALVAGVPVVGRAAGGTAEIVGDGMGVLVTGESAEEFAEALVRACSMSIPGSTRFQVAARFGRKAFREAVRNFVEESRSCPAPLSMPPPQNMPQAA